MKVIIEYDLDDPHSVQYAEYHLHRKLPAIKDLLFTLTHVLFESDCKLEDRFEMLMEVYDKIKIYNELMAYQLAQNQQLKDIIEKK